MTIKTRAGWNRGRKGLRTHDGLVLCRPFKDVKSIVLRPAGKEVQCEIAIDDTDVPILIQQLQRMIGDTGPRG